MSDAGQAPRVKLWQWLLWGLLGAALSVQVVRMRVAEGAVREGNGALASQIRPQNGWGRALNAERLFKQNNLRAASAESLAALRRTPLAVVAVRTLAQVRDKQSGPGAGETAWQAAAMMGWRDKPTQYWGVMRALANGEAAILAMRSDALLRTGDPGGRMAVLIRGLMREPEVRAAFVERLALGPAWRRHFLTYALGRRGDDLDGLVATLHELGRTRSPPSRFETRVAIDGLIARRRFAEAAALHRMVAGRAPVLPLEDGTFERGDAFYRNGSTPFDWTIRLTSNSTASLDESEGRSMTVSTTGQRAQAAVRRYVLVEPGAYRLGYTMRGEPGSPGLVGVRVACAPGARPIAQSARDSLASRGWEARQIAFRASADCPLLSIELGGSGGESGEAQFDNFQLQRIDRAAAASR